MFPRKHSTPLIDDILAYAHEYPCILEQCIGETEYNDDEIKTFCIFTKVTLCRYDMNIEFEQCLIRAIKNLIKEHIFIYDQDYTSDISGCCDKKVFGDNLIKYEGFLHEKSCGSYKKSGKAVIQDDTNKVSRWCLTFRDDANLFDTPTRV